LSYFSGFVASHDDQRDLNRQEQQQQHQKEKKKFTRIIRKAINLGVNDLPATKLR
jgi:hypothetical protein